MSDNGERATGPTDTRRLAIKLLDPRVQLAVDLAAANRAVHTAEATRRAAEQAEVDSRAAYGHLYEKCLAAAWTPGDLRQFGCEPVRAGRPARRSRRRQAASPSGGQTAPATAPDAASAELAARPVGPVAQHTGAASAGTAGC